MIPAASLQILKEHARQLADDAAAGLQQAKLRWTQAQQKLDDLGQYLQGYRQRLTQTAQSGMTVQAMRDYYQFIAKLELAVRLQGEEVGRARGQWEMGYRAWQEAMQKVKAYDLLEARQKAQKQHLDNRREQKKQDERAGRGGRGPLSA